MNAVSVDRQRNGKAIGTERQTGLEIVLLKRTYVFPWSQFLYAEGGDDEIRAVFTTHDLIVRGTALTGLLGDLAGQGLDLTGPGGVVRTQLLDLDITRFP